MRYLTCVLCLVFAASCTTPAPEGGAPASGPVTSSSENRTPKNSASDNLEPLPGGPKGILRVDVTDISGKPVRARVELQDRDAHTIYVEEVPRGMAELRPPVGTYKAYIHVYDKGIAYLTDIQDVVIGRAESAFLSSRMVEGRTETLRIADFDTDGDRATDSVEWKAGTDSKDVTSVPGRVSVPYTYNVINPEARWYRGDLQVHTRHGRGSESVAELVARAERSGLEFMAITDINTLDSISDPAYHSDKVTLIPAMEWGTAAMGHGLIYGPGTVPAPPSTVPAAQSVSGLVQAQGGVFAVAHPCSSRAPWQWGLSYVNGIEVWCGPWRGEAPLPLNRLNANLLATDDAGNLIHSIAAAVKMAEISRGAAKAPELLKSLGATPGDAKHLVMSANMQAEKFWDYEMGRSLMASAIGGSDSTGPNTPLGQPLVYVYARENSVPGILEGLRLGRTYLSRGMDGPKIIFHAQFLTEKNEVGLDGASVGMGGAIPLGTNVQFEIIVTDARGLDLEVIRNGHLSISKEVEGTPFVFKWRENLNTLGSYRVRVTGKPIALRDGYGAREVHALTSPIFVRNIFYEAPPERQVGIVTGP